MSLFEYDKELHERTLIEEGREEGERIGRESGHREGRKEGQNLLANAILLCRSKKISCADELIAEGFDEETARLALSIK